MNFKNQKRGRHILISLLLFVSGLLLVCSSAVASSTSESPAVARVKVFKEANDFFRQAGETNDPNRADDLYNKALLRYEKLTHEGLRNGKLYYNIGNTYFRLHNLGLAILNYRLAQHYLPDDQNLSQNLAFALSLQPDKIIPKQQKQIMKTLLFWHYDFSKKTRWIIFGIAAIFFWLIAFVKLARGGQGPGLAGLFPFIVFLLMGGSLSVSHFWPPKEAGVVLAKEVVARKGDGLSHQPSFTEPLHAGLDFDLVEKRNGWLYIELRDGRRCWIPENGASVISYKIPQIRDNNLVSYQ